MTDASPSASADQFLRRLSSADASASTRAGDHLLRNEQHERLTAALASLPPSDREVVVMRHLEHLSTAEIAATLEISETVVKARLLRALLRMREELGDSG